MSSARRDLEVRRLLMEGIAIPASPLALDERRRFDPTYQKLLYRYYAEAGAGGVAVAVHSTQFEIRHPEFALFQPVLELAAETLKGLEARRGQPIVRVAGVCGATNQAAREAETARALGYDLALLSLVALREADDDALIDHCRTVAGLMPIVGFYLQPKVGGRALSYRFWRRFAELENVAAIKVAPFNRYHTLDVVRAVAMAGRADDIALYTGNDDNIIADLLSPYRIRTPEGERTLRFRGGLLGQWCVWTQTAVSLLEQIKAIVRSGGDAPAELLARNIELTDANAAVFDAANDFAGCIPGINEVLRRQGLLRTALCLDPRLTLSPGQADELDRVARDYPWLPDDAFVHEHREEWYRECR